METFYFVSADLNQGADSTVTGFWSDIKDIIS